MIHTNNYNRIDTERFHYALSVYGEQKSSKSSEDTGKSISIGTLGEKSLHAVLKLYYEPDITRHEQQIGAHIADIVNEDGIIEIQTRNLSALRPKLNAFLNICRVTVVHPVIASKRIISINGDTGEVISVRKSPKHGTIYSEIRELYTLREFLTRENIALRFPLLAADEYRTFGVRTKRRKKQRTKSGEYISDTLPTNIIDEIRLDKPSDYAIFLPEGLPAKFTTHQFAAAAETDEQSARMTINLLIRTGQLDQNAHLKNRRSTGEKK